LRLDSIVGTRRPERRAHGSLPLKRSLFSRSRDYDPFLSADFPIQAFAQGDNV
jgi:hypothetical protein